MLFGVPTMYHRLAKAAEAESLGWLASASASRRIGSSVKALAGARVLVSGSAPLAAQDRDTIQRLTGKCPIERYGLTETLIVCAMPPASSSSSSSSSSTAAAGDPALDRPCPAST